LFVLFNCTGEEENYIPNPPYIDENGNIDWDKKFEDEINK
jgi:hypothetical protein